MTFDFSKLHVAIIMDGNGRWAKKRGLMRFLGHKEGVSTVKKIVKYSAKLNLGYLSMFAFSAENWLRPKEEISFLMGLLEDYVKSEWQEIVENNIILKLSGELEKLPKKTLELLESLAQATKGNSGMVLNLVVSYGSKDEIANAVKKIAAQLKNGNIKESEISPELIRKNLYHPEIPDVDLLIRTSGEHRLSNFMLWQSAYAELYFTDVLWPDFSEKELDNALEDFSRRVRRFGKTDEQIGN